MYTVAHTYQSNTAMTMIRQIRIRSMTTTMIIIAQVMFDASPGVTVGVTVGDPKVTGR